MIRFETPERFGNFAKPSIRSLPSGDIEASFTAHPHGGPESLWFCFRLCGDGKPQRIRLRLEHFRTLLGGNQATGFCPVMRAPGEAWRRLAPGTEIVEPDGQVTAVWNFELSSASVEIAACFPYGQTELDALLQDHPGAFNRHAIGVSQQGRAIERLSNTFGDETSNNQPLGIYIVARQHSGETTGSWVLDGLLRTITSKKNAPLVWAIPFSNIDGIEQGDYGKDNFPYDLNRAWGKPPMRFETLVIQQDILRWKRRCRPALVLDLHAPAACEDSGEYFFTAELAEDLPLDQRQRRWLQSFEHHLGDWASIDRFARVARHASRWATPTLTRWSRSALDVPGLSLETQYSMIRGRILGIAEFREIGACLARAIQATMIAQTASI